MWARDSDRKAELIDKFSCKNHESVYIVGNVYQIMEVLCLLRKDGDEHKQKLQDSTNRH